MSAHLVLSLFLTTSHAIPSVDSSPEWTDPRVLRGCIARLGDDGFRHGVRLNGMAYSPDGRLIATLGYRKLVRVWDARSGRLLYDFPDRGNGNHDSIGFSPGGRYIAIGSGSQRVQVWNLETGKELSIPSTCRAGFAFLDDDTIACRRDLSTLILVQLRTGEQIGEWSKSDAFNDVVIVSPDRRMVAARTKSGEVGLWDATNGTALRTFGAGKLTDPSLAFSPDSKFVYTLSKGAISRWDVKTAKDVELIAAGEPTITSFEPTPDGNSLITVDESGKIRVLAADTGKELRSCETDRSGEIAIHVNPDGKSFALQHGWFQSCPTFWTTDKLTPMVKCPSHTGTIWGLSFSEDGRTLLSCGLDRSLIRWDLGSKIGDELIRRPPPNRQCCCASSPDGSRFGTGSSDTKEGLGLWDVQTGKRLELEKVFKGTVYAVAFSPDGHLFAAVSKSGIHLWEADSGKAVRDWSHRLGMGYLHPLVFSADGTTIVAAGDQYIEAWEVATGKERFSFKLTDDAYRLAVSEDGTRLAWSTSADESVLSVANINRYRPVQTAKVQGQALGLAFSPGAAVLAVGLDRPDGGAVELWEAESMRMIRRSGTTSSPIMTLAFAPDGRTLALGGIDSTIVLWDVTGRRVR